MCENVCTWQSQQIRGLRGFSHRMAENGPNNGLLSHFPKMLPITGVMLNTHSHFANENKLIVAFSDNCN